MYTLLKYCIKIALRLFYRRHQVVGIENIPKDAGVIFVGNHQNALMDALNIVCNSGRSPYFATRADLFKKDWIKKILLYLKLFPVYRLRDGRENMQQNNDAFDFFSQKLLEGKAVGIFPEGQAAYQYHVLPFKKGMARLAFKTLEKNPNQKLYAVPSGLQYENKHHYQADILIQFGKAILVNDYYKLYQEKPGRAIRQLTLDAHAALKELLIHIPVDENYESINQKRALLYQNSKGTLLEKFQAGKELIAKNGAVDIPSKNKSRAYYLLPLAFIGFILHYPIRKWIHTKSHQSVKDSQFLATAKFMRGFLIMPVYYALLGIAIYYFLPNYCLFLLLLLPLVGRVSWNWGNS